MPTRVRAHTSHTRYGKRMRVRSYVRYGPEHTAKWKRLVRHLKHRGDVKNPEAVATAALGPRGTFRY